jgi:riboflavin kinase/FMN adenylyltransferase
MSLAVFNSGREWTARFGVSGQGSVVTIGNFDGMHLGHQAVLGKVVECAQALGAISTAVTFDPPPLKVLRPAVMPPRISTNEQRLEWFRALGLDAAVVLRFDRALAQISAEDFVRDILVIQLRPRAIFVGEDFCFGRGRSGDAALLRRLGPRFGFQVAVVPPARYRSEVVSSTAIRRAVAKGDVARAARFLGRPFALTGDIRAGAGIGSKFVFPTLNLSAEQELLPLPGVYVTETCVAGQTFSSVTNIGHRPTFNGSSLSIESHLLGFSQRLSRGRMEVRFWKRLRDEKRFPGPVALRAQIARDIARAQRFFAHLNEAASKSDPVRVAR